MRKTVLAILATCALGFAVPAQVEGEGDATPQAAPQTALPIPPPCTPAKRIYSLKHWRRAHPARSADVCPSKTIDKQRDRFFEYRRYRQVAPYRSTWGAGPRSPADGRYYAIPWPVVCGESRGDFHVNDDGAYQIIPSTWASYGGGRFAPTAGAATPLEQHIIAHRAWGHEPWYGYATDC